MAYNLKVRVIFSFVSNPSDELRWDNVFHLPFLIFQGVWLLGPCRFFAIDCASNVSPSPETLLLHYLELSEVDTHGTC